MTKVTFIGYGVANGTEWQNPKIIPAIGTKVRIKPTENYRFIHSIRQDGPDHLIVRASSERN